MLNYPYIALKCPTLLTVLQIFKLFQYKSLIKHLFVLNTLLAVVQAGKLSSDLVYLLDLLIFSLNIVNLYSAFFFHRKIQLFHLLLFLTYSEQVRSCCDKRDSSSVSKQGSAFDDLLGRLICPPLWLGSQHAAAEIFCR